MCVRQLSIQERDKKIHEMNDAFRAAERSFLKLVPIFEIRRYKKTVLLGHQLAPLPKVEIPWNQVPPLSVQWKSARKDKFSDDSVSRCMKSIWSSYPASMEVTEEGNYHTIKTLKEKAILTLQVKQTDQRETLEGKIWRSIWSDSA